MKSPINLGILLAFVLIIRCSFPVFLKYQVNLSGVEKSASTHDSINASNNLEFTPGDVSHFSDDLIGGYVWFTDNGIAFRITNKSDQAIRLSWDGASFVEANGTVTRIIHNGIKYEERGKSMPPTTIPKGATVEDEIVPINRITWKEGSPPKYVAVGRSLIQTSPGSLGGWENAGLFPCRYNVPSLDPNVVQTIVDENKRYIGSKIAIFLPFAVGTEEIMYTLFFTVKDVSLKK